MSNRPDDVSELLNCFKHDMFFFKHDMFFIKHDMFFINHDMFFIKHDMFFIISVFITDILVMMWLLYEPQVASILIYENEKEKE